MSNEDVADIVQATFKTCVQRRDTYCAQNDATFKTWLFGIARMKLYEHFKQQKKLGRMQLMDPAEMTCEELGGSPSTWLRDKHDRELLQRALPRLPLDHQLLLELYLWEGFKGRELAEIMDLKEETTRARIRRAKALLEREVGKLTSGVSLEESLRSISDWVVDMQRERDERYPELRDGVDQR